MLTTSTLLSWWKVLEAMDQPVSKGWKEAVAMAAPVKFRARTAKLLHGLSPLFAVTVLIPTLAAVLYFGLFASDVYLSESRFVVRAPDKPSTTGFGALLKSAGFSNAGDEIYAARSYVQSRDSLAELNAKGAIRTAYSRPSISIFDRYNALGMSGSFEDLFKYFQKKVTVDYDTTTSITTLTVRAYTADDAQKINQRLLAASEQMINKLNARGRQDLIQFAETEVYEAVTSARQAAAALARYRNRSGVIDPERQAQVQLQMISKLQDELIGAETQLRQLRQLAPENPQIPILNTRISELRRQIGQQSGAVAGSSNSLSANAAEFSRLELEQQLAAKRVTAAMQSLEEARNEARRKQAYVERIAQPSLPDEPLEPRRLRGIIATLLLGLLAWAILSMLIAGVREHQD